MKKKFDITPYLFILPAFLFFVVFILYPVTRAVLLAFQEYNLSGEIKFVGFKNFINGVVKDPVFWLAMKNTVLYSIIRVPVNVFVGLIIATLIFHTSNKWQSFFRAAYYLPGVISLVVISMVWKWLYNPNYGLLNQLLIQLGIISEPIPWLTSSKWALPSLMLMAILSSPGSAIILYLAAMSNIPTSIYEAASLEGADEFTQWYKITVPLLNNTTLYLLVMNTIASFQVFTQVYVMTRGGPGYASTMITPLIYFRAFKDYEFGIASAQALVLFLVILGISLIQFKYIRRRGEYI
ncbi:MAG: sugar ABC transporter permease [Endomicrobia bacterium]|nr:sugar ABC transporter permease [Endomicrobiia bacterium]MCX7716015.1 sugar ABC transporter permease [Endomicrobiia bacterium]